MSRNLVGKFDLLSSVLSLVAVLTVIWGVKEWAIAAIGGGSGAILVLLTDLIVGIARSAAVCKARPSVATKDSRRAVATPPRKPTGASSSRAAERSSY